jgi:hypothetical protein
VRRSKASGAGATDARGAHRGDPGCRITGDTVTTEPLTPERSVRRPAEAETFRRMSESGFRRLAKHVKEHGLNVPVVPLRSVKDGTTLATVVFDTKCDPSAVVRSRHLTPEQKERSS